MQAAYTVGAAIAIKKKDAEERRTQRRQSVRDFSPSVSWPAADQRKVGLGHGNLGKMLRRRDDCFCFLAGHESLQPQRGAIGIAEKRPTKWRQKPSSALS